MMKKIAKKEKIYLIFSFFVPLILIALILVPNMIEHNGIFYISSDYILQELPLNISFNDQLKENGLNYTFENELGGNLISCYSYYNMFSPFNLLNYILPSNIIPYAMGYILMLKFAFAGLSSFLFLDNVIKNKKYAFIGCLLYAFSGYQIVNMFFYQFNDVTAFFPLLLLSLDKLMLQEKKGFLAITLSLCIITNYIFAFGEIIFLVIYFFVNILFKRYTLSRKNFFRLLLEGMVALGTCSFILLPSALEIVKNPKETEKFNLGKFKYMIFFDLSMYLKIFQTFLFTGENSFYALFKDAQCVTSMGICMPFINIVAIIMWIINNPKDKWNVLLYICLVFMGIRILNSSFMMFTKYIYARWYYMPSLIFALVSVKGLQSQKKSKTASIITIIITITYMIILVLYTIKIQKSNLSINIYSKISLILGITSVVLSYFAIEYSIKHNNIIFIIIGISIYTVIAGNNFIYCMNNGNNTFETFENIYALHKNIKKYDDIINDNTFYRIDCKANLFQNMNLYLKKPGINNYISTMHPSVYKIYGGMNLLDQNQISAYTNEYTKFKNIVSVKYVITEDDYEHLGKYIKIYEDDKYSIYVNTYCKPMGYTYNQTLALSEFLKLSEVKDKIEAYCNYIILKDEDLEKYEKIINSGTTENSYTTIEKGRIISNISLPSENLVFYTIPYDKDFVAYDNGKETEIIEVGNGFMAVKAEKGENYIVIKYKNTYLKIGILIGIINQIILLIYISINSQYLKVRRKK